MKEISNVVKSFLENHLFYPIWIAGRYSISHFEEQGGAEEFFSDSIIRGEIGDLFINQFTDDGCENTVEILKDPQPVYSDSLANYYAICSDWRSSIHFTFLKEIVTEKRRWGAGITFSRTVHQTRDWYLLKVNK